MPPALEFNGVTKRYLAGARGCCARADVLREVDLSVLEGESVALVGAAGAGKSTLLFVAAGLLAPDSGAVRWFGDEHRATATARASYVFTGARSATRSHWNQGRAPHLHLIDSPELLPPETASRLARWIERKTRSGDAVVVGTRDASLGESLSDRVVLLHGGRTFAPSPPVRAARVAERAVASRGSG